MQRPHPEHRRLPRAVLGMTLVEVAVAVTIIAILSAIAIPAYTEYLVRGRRADGRAALLAARQQMERFYAAGSPTQYTTDLAGNGFAGTSEDGKYTLSAVACAGSTAAACVELRAQPVTADATCGTLTLNTAGARGAIIGGTASSDQTLIANCWQR
ncbi:MAG TPA: type IV pilin protein [Burkholderiaceae bacterium]|nr:type IV pilin protein [Burkholderiaceae bacterium]